MATTKTRPKAKASGPDSGEPGEEITELESIEPSRVDGVKAAASGFPILMLKSLAKADGDGEDGPTHGAFSGTHSHPHDANGAQGEDDTHDHSHSHDGDGDHSHAHSGGAKSAAWHPAAAQLVKLAAAAPAIPRDVLFKAVAADGSVDEQPDIDGGKQAIALIAKLIGYEADELAAGCFDEVFDIGLLCQAVSALKCWLAGEQDEDGQDGDDMMPLMAAVAMSAAEPWVYEPDDVAKDNREFSAADRKKHAEAGNALPDGSYPIPDKDALRRAAVLARSKHGNWQAARRLIARRAKELGVANPLDSGDGKDGGSSKSVVAEGTPAVDTVTQGDQLAKLATDVETLTKALQASEERAKTFEAELAKVKATPIPGGPVMSVARPHQAATDEHAAKAAYFEQMANSVANPADADGYRQLAAQEKAKATQAT
jgi:hypothetical protein